MPSINFDNLNNHQAKIKELRSFVASPYSQAIKAAAMATPEGRSLSANLGVTFERRAEVVKAEYQAAAHDTIDIMMSSGISEKEISSFQNKLEQAENGRSVSGSIHGGEGSDFSVSAELKQNINEVSTKKGTNQLLELIEKTDPLTSDNCSAEDQTIISKIAYTRNFVNDLNISIEQQQKFKVACDLHSQDGKPVTLHDYCDNLLNTAEENNIPLSEKDKTFLEQLRDSKRYKDLLVDKSEGCEVGNVSTQIIALRNEDESHAFFGIAGTNASLRDWKNDMLFISDDITEEEDWINKKINQYAYKYDSLDIAGHSQGGREAITAALFLSDENKDKLQNIYSLDGPGYNQAFIEKYSYLFDQIRDQITHIYPTDSVVGHILTFPGGKVLYVEAATSDIYSMTHYMETWNIKDGSFTTFDGPDDLSALIREVTNYFASKLPPDALEEVLPPILNVLSSTKNPVNLSTTPVHDFIKNLDTISLGDAVDALATVGVLVSEAYVDFYDLIDDYIVVAETILAGLSIVPWPGAAVCASICVFLNEIDSILEGIDKVAKAVSFIASLYVEQKASKKREERENYLNQNPTIKMNCAYLRNAIECLMQANTSLKNADNDADIMRREGVSKKTWIEKFVDGISQGTSNTIIVRITGTISVVLKALKYTGNALMDLCFLQSNANLVKGTQAIERIINSSQNIANSISVTNSGEIYQVSPGVLSTYASKAQNEVNKMKESIADAQSAITQAGTVWQANDFDSLKASSDTIFSDIIDGLENMEKHYASIGEIATAYANFQKTCVKEFQEAAN